MPIRFNTVYLTSKVSMTFEVWLYLDFNVITLSTGIGFLRNNNVPKLYFF